MGLLVGTETRVSLGDICPSCKVLFKNGVLFLKIAPPPPPPSVSFVFTSNLWLWGTFDLIRDCFTCAQIVLKV